MNYKILYSILFLILASATYVWATSNANDVVLIERPTGVSFERNFTVSGLANNQAFFINITAEGLTGINYIPVIIPIISNSNQADITIKQPAIDFENRNIFNWTMSNGNVQAKNVTLWITISGLS